MTLIEDLREADYTLNEAVDCLERAKLEVEIAELDVCIATQNFHEIVALHAAECNTKSLRGIK